nr:MAG TPA: Helix-turn-helix XRE-family like protein [Caudoviricetes sp.]
MIVNRVRELRVAAGMTQKALADQLGVTVPTVSKWELGQRTPELERVFRMTLIFGVPIEEIVQRTESA